MARKSHSMKGGGMKKYKSPKGTSFAATVGNPHGGGYGKSGGGKGKMKGGRKGY